MCSQLGVGHKLVATQGGLSDINEIAAYTGPVCQASVCGQLKMKTPTCSMKFCVSVRVNVSDEFVQVWLALASLVLMQSDNFYTGYLFGPAGRNLSFPPKLRVTLREQAAERLEARRCRRGPRYASRFLQYRPC